jgi:hypothetical protein
VETLVRCVFITGTTYTGVKTPKGLESEDVGVESGDVGVEVVVVVEMVVVDVGVVEGVVVGVVVGDVDVDGVRDDE